MSFESFNNESAAQGGGAGIQAAQFSILKFYGSIRLTQSILLKCRSYEYTSLIPCSFKINELYWTDSSLTVNPSVA